MKSSGGIRKRRCGHSAEPPFRVPRLAGALPLSQDTVPAKATDPVQATEVLAVVPATHERMARVSCVSVECVAASCAISYAEEMGRDDVHYSVYF